MITLEENEVIEFKKKHPCGGYSWKVLRSGSDCRLMCTTCGHQIEIARYKVEQNLKNKKP